jgi:hypothetical protein
MEKVIGTCSECHGRVCISFPWHSVLPQIPRCIDCGATMAKPHGPVIPMVPREDHYKDETPHPGWSKELSPWEWPEITFFQKTWC